MLSSKDEFEQFSTIAWKRGFISNRAQMHLGIFLIASKHDLCTTASKRV